MARWWRDALGKNMRLAPWVAALLLVAGGSGSGDPVLIINNQQSLVMDPSVLSAGITAEPPSLTTDRGWLRAYSLLSNDRPAQVTVHYRFYWYDAQGLYVTTVRRHAYADRAA